MATGDVTDSLQRTRGPDLGGWLAILGALALAGCLWFAITSGPMVLEDEKWVPAAEITEEECQQLQAKNDSSDPRDADGVLRLIAIGPAKTEIGRHVCLIAAGVVPHQVVTAAAEDAEAALAAYTAAQGKLDAAIEANRQGDIPNLQKVVDKTELDLEAARAKLSESRPPVPLAIFLNDMLSPLRVDARSTDEVQRLWFRLSAPESAADTGAAFWRELVRGVAGQGPANWGEIRVSFGLSRAASATTVPETGAEVSLIADPNDEAAKAASAKISTTLYVYSRLPVFLGLVSLGFFVLALIVYSRRSSLLRDNNMTCEMLPGNLRAAQWELERSRLARDEAGTDLAGAPTDADKIAAATAAMAALDAARARIRALESAFDKIPEHREARRQLGLRTREAEQAHADIDDLDDAAQEAQSAFDAAETKLKQASGRDAAEQDVAQKDAANQQAPSPATAAALATAKARLERTGRLEDAVAKLTAARADLEKQTRKANGRKTTALTAAEGAVDKALREMTALSGPAGAPPLDRQALTDKEAEIADAQADLVRAKLQRDSASKAQGDAKALLDKEEKAAETLAKIQEGKFDDQYARWAVGPFSLGRTQMAFWLFLVVAAYIYIAMSIGQIFGILNNNILILLGISGLTGVGAAILTTSNEGRVSRGFFRDILSEDQAPQLQRLQAVGWTLVLGGVFVFIVAHAFRLPEFDATLLLMMGLVNGLYVGLKTQGGGKGAPADTPK